MALNRLERWVTIRNITDKMQRLYDRQLPNGYIDVGPGAEATLPASVFQRTWRTSWFVRAESVQQPPTETEPEPERDMADWSIKELRAKAAEIGLTIPVGTTKIDAAKMIQAAIAEGKSNETA